MASEMEEARPPGVPRANLPQAPPLSAIQLQIAELIAQGKSALDIARAVHPDNKRDRRQLTHKIRRWTRTNPQFQAKIVEIANSYLAEGLGPAYSGLARRASSGKAPEVKLLAELLGLHSSKQRTEHSGEVKITLDMPRPTNIDDGQPSGLDPEPELVDADVVED